MNVNPATGADCVVVNGEKLPPETGGPAELCAAIKAALDAQGGDRAVQVEIRVKSNSWIVAHIERDGMALSDQNLAIADGKLKKSSIERFARAIAQAVSTAG